MMPTELPHGTTVIWLVVETKGTDPNYRMVYPGIYLSEKDALDAARCLEFIPKSGRFNAIPFYSLDAFENRGVA